MNAFNNLLMQYVFVCVFLVCFLLGVFFSGATRSCIKRGAMATVFMRHTHTHCIASKIYAESLILIHLSERGFISRRLTVHKPLARAIKLI